MIFIYEANTANSKGEAIGVVAGIVSIDFGTLDEKFKGGRLRELIEEDVRKLIKKDIDERMPNVAGISLKDVRKICD